MTQDANAKSASTLKERLSAAIDGPRELWRGFVNRLRGVRDITPLEASRLIVQENALVLDVREQHEYDAGHIQNPVLIPLGELESRLSEIEGQKHAPIVVICHGGKRSATACARLAKHDFPHSFNIAGGILAWKRADLRVVT